ncbi:MAG: hypothetical protein Q9186_000925 [Xanthomendoza sp. 1 TL-2023]
MTDPHAAAAPPLLGSTLLAIAEKQALLQPSPASSGNHAIDTEALDGGYRYGEITCIAGASGTGKTLLAFQAIASHLITHKEGEVALIATTDIPLTRLKDVLVNRITRQKRAPEFCESGYVYRKQVATADPTQDVQTCVALMLERVRLSRAFDFPGVAEAIGEFGARLEAHDVKDKAKSHGVDHRGARTVADSEDEVESNPSPKKKDHVHEDAPGARVEAAEIIPASMIVIDNVANVLGSMMTKSQLQGHAMLANCMRSLQHLTKRRSICTLLVNAAVALRPQSTQYQRKTDEQVSIFASILGKPALGKHFSFLIDTSVFLSMLPRSKDDADIAYNDGHEARDYEKVGIFEVLKDRHGIREGRWSVFRIREGVELHSGKV